MKQLILAGIALLCSLHVLAIEPKAIDSATNWLKVVDSGNYTESWHQSGDMFQRQLSSQEWESALSKVRTPLGKPITRKVKTSSEYSSLPGAPDGTYVVVDLETSFQHKESALETVTVIKSGEGWQVVGYFIN